jgi:hypothetical protein
MAAEAKIDTDSNVFKLEELDPAPEIFVDGYQGVVIANGQAIGKSIEVKLENDTCYKAFRIGSLYISRAPWIIPMSLAVRSSSEVLRSFQRNENSSQ